MAVSYCTRCELAKWALAQTRVVGYGSCVMKTDALGSSTQRRHKLDLPEWSELCFGDAQGG